MYERLQRALELDSASAPPAFFGALGKSIDPAGPARAEGVAAYGELAQRLAARPDGEPRRVGFWEVQARAWHAIVRLQQLQPDAAPIRADVAALLAVRPDSALARELATRVEHRAWAPAAATAGLTWQSLGSDPAGDGINASAPELRGLDFAPAGDRLWFRFGFAEPLPPSFGVNLAIDRDGDPAGDHRWWGGDSRFRFDRLVTAWVVREGDGWFGLAGVTDADGARTQRLMNLSHDLQVRITDDGRGVEVGVPAAALALGAGAQVLAAGGSNLMWNDNLPAVGGGGISLPDQ
jgi:hypothetical protein